MDKIYQKNLPSAKNAAKRRLGGFTLIELLVVVLIIVILATVAVPQYQKAVRRSRYLSVLPLARSIVDAENRYFLANGAYTYDFEDLDITLPAQFKGSGGLLQDFKGTHFVLASNADGSEQRLYFDASGDDQIYLIWFFARNELRCYAPLSSTDSLCASLGGKKMNFDWADVYELHF